MSALSGITVVELAREPVAFAGKLLADLGADVILVEPPGGADMRRSPPFVDDEPGVERSLCFLHYHTNKRGVVLDFDDADDRERLKQLILRADVLLEAEPRQRLAEFDLDYGNLAAHNAGLIHVAATSHGRERAESDAPAVDLTLLSAGGPVWNCGYDDHALPPVRGWGNQAYHTAAHFAVMSVLTALLAREAHGRGQFVDLSMTAALNVTTEAGSYAWLVAQETVQRQTGRHAASRPTGETQMQCADGRWVNTGVPPRFPADFGKLLAWLQELDLVDSFPEAVFLEMGANWEGHFDLSQIGIDDTITAIFAAGREALQLVAKNLPAQAFFEGCQQAGLTVGVINAPEEAFEDLHFVARGMQRRVMQNGVQRELTQVGNAFELPAAPSAPWRSAPLLGEHNDELF